MHSDTKVPRPLTIMRLANLVHPIYNTILTVMHQNGEYIILQEGVKLALQELEWHIFDINIFSLDSLYALKHKKHVKS